MTELKPPPRRRGSQMITPPRKPRSSDETEERRTSSKAATVVTEEVSDPEIQLPRQINLTKAVSDSFRSVVPKWVLRQAPFQYRPQAFSVESERLNARIMSAEIQKNSLRNWIKSPTSPVNFCVTGSPDDSKAAYFAAYLLHIHMKHLGAYAVPVWETIYGGYDNPKSMSRSENLGSPTILVIQNLSVNSTNSKINKAQDLIQTFPDIPKIIIATGEDPISFMSSRLYKSVQGITYFSESIVKKSIEVV